MENSRSDDRALDETLEETFPASDAAANTVETGIRVGQVPLVPAVTDNREASQFELVDDGQTAVLTYERTPTSLVLVHTEVPPPLRGRHLADALAKAAIDAARAEGLSFVAVCPFVKAYLRKHPFPPDVSATDVPQGQPPKSEIRGEPVTRTLWILAKDGHTMTCVISGEPGREELQVLFDREVYLSETHSVHEGVVGRARTLHRGFEAHGWAAVFEAANSDLDRP